MCCLIIPFYSGWQDRSEHALWFPSNPPELSVLTNLECVTLVPLFSPQMICLLGTSRFWKPPHGHQSGVYCLGINLFRMLAEQKTKRETKTQGTLLSEHMDSLTSNIFQVKITNFKFKPHTMNQTFQQSPPDSSGSKLYSWSSPEGHEDNMSVAAYVCGRLFQQRMTAEDDHITWIQLQ